MKKSFAILLLAVLFVGSELQSQDTAKPALRTWKDSTGQFSIQATFVRVNGDQVVLQGVDKKEISLPLTKLSAADQQYVKARLTSDSSTGKTITNTIGMKLNLIPAGSFMMGRAENENDDETNHKVTITKDFYMQTAEVTQGQWKALMGTEPWKGKDYTKVGPNYAASYVSWNDAVAYCKKLSEKEAKTYRLPTEAEWEYACRAGTKTTWSFGDDEKELGDYAWYNQNTFDVGEKYAHEVRLKKPMRLGCTTCTATFGNGATIITKRIITSSHPNRIHRAQRQAQSVFCGVGRGGLACPALLPLTAKTETLITATHRAAFASFVSWISSVVIQHSPTPAHVFVVPTPPRRRARKMGGLVKQIVDLQEQILRKMG